MCELDDDSLEILSLTGQQPILGTVLAIHSKNAKFKDVPLEKKSPVWCSRHRGTKFATPANQPRPSWDGSLVDRPWVFSADQNGLKRCSWPVNFPRKKKKKKKKKTKIFMRWHHLKAKRSDAQHLWFVGFANQLGLVSKLFWWRCSH